jgi:hypothetical protein
MALQNRVKTVDIPLPARGLRRPISKAADQSTAKFQRLIHRLLCLLIFSVIFEGVSRKLVPQSLGIIVFFLKDMLTIALLLLCLKRKSNPEASRLLGLMGRLLLLLAPCVLVTAIHDPVLAVFGMKQYALFPTVAVAMCAAYVPYNSRLFFSLLRWIAFSVVITTSFAVAQNRLPSASWLNLSVAGDDLVAFSAGGYLRVSSTFPFVAQYCYYLNALCYFLPAYFFFNHIFHGRAAILQIVILLGLLIIGTFITGSRGSVVGNAGILSAAGLLCVCFAGAKGLIKVMALAVLGIVLLAVIQSQSPDFFAAYQARVDGTTESSHAIEIEKRIEQSLLGWTENATLSFSGILGNGLGVMSNGSDKFSAYAASWRRAGNWTETDQATTLFEGGSYLILVWYGFRFWIIIHCLTVILKLRHLEFRLVACFAWGFIFIIGVTGTLAIQPPLAIWWWLAIGLVTCLRSIEREQMTKPVNLLP